MSCKTLWHGALLNSFPTFYILSQSIDLFHFSEPEILDAPNTQDINDNSSPSYGSENESESNGYSDYDSDGGNNKSHVVSS